MKLLRAHDYLELLSEEERKLITKPGRRLTSREKTRIKILCDKGVKQVRIAEMFRISKSTISRIVRPSKKIRK
jgi:DNA-directed RNA polymerase specialized sigma subunit